MSAIRGGFTPTRHLNGLNSFQTERFKKSTGGTDASLVYVGDLVRLLADGTVARQIPGDVSANSSATATPSTIGVVARVFTSENGKPRVHGLPAQHPNISLTADADWLDVFVDPGIVFTGKISGSAGRTMLGQTMNITTTARVTAAGISGQQLDAASSAASENPFRVIALSPYNLDSRAGDAAGRVEVVLNNCVLKTVLTV